MTCKQVSVFLENRKGSLAEVCKILGNAGINLMALSIAETDNYGICRMILSDTDKGMEVLKKAGYTVRITPVLVVCVPDRPNGLADVLSIIDKENVSVEYLYSFVRNSGFDALLIFRLSDAAAAEKALVANYIKILTEEQVRGL